MTQSTNPDKQCLDKGRHAFELRSDKFVETK